MEFLLQRKHFKPLYTIGRLYADMRYLCDTMEPSTHGLRNKAWTRPKIKKAKAEYGSVAIPPGRYRLLMTRSPRFGRWLPLLAGVQGFSGIRIHAGNKPADTRGCILPGFNKRKGYVLQSTTCMNEIMSLIQSALDKGKPVFITVRE